MIFAINYIHKNISNMNKYMNNNEYMYYEENSYEQSYEDEPYYENSYEDCSYEQECYEDAYEEDEPLRKEENVYEDVRDEMDAIDEELSRPLSADEKRHLEKMVVEKITISKISTDAMDAEYEAFLAEQEQRERRDAEEKENKMISEISAFVAKGGKVIGETLEDHYESMKRQQLEELKKWEVSKKKAVEQPIQQAAPSSAPKKKRKQRKENKLNAKGKEQGKPKVVEKTMGKRAQRKARALCQPKPRVIEEVVKVPADKIVKIEDIIDNLPVEEAKEEEPYIMPVISVPKIEDYSITNKDDNNKKSNNKKSKKKFLDLNPQPVPIEKNETFKGTHTTNMVQSATAQRSCTQLCTSVLAKTKCLHGTRCRFAHKIEDLARHECNFGVKCRYTEKISETEYQNSSSIKKCLHWHPSESSESYGYRMGLISKPKPKITKIKFTLAPWAKPVKECVWSGACWSKIVGTKILDQNESKPEHVKPEHVKPEDVKLETETHANNNEDVKCKNIKIERIIESDKKMKRYNRWFVLRIKPMKTEDIKVIQIQYKEDIARDTHTCAKTVPIPENKKCEDVCVKIEPRPVVKEPEALKCTQLCNSLYTRVECRHGKRCNFAHSVEQLVQRQCMFGEKCKFVEKIETGCYVNCGDVKCLFWHPDESCDSFSNRMGIRRATQTKTQVKTVPIKVIQTKIPMKVAPAKVAPWKK